ncbi:hypothetical protein [Pseudooceanicola sp. LIPI14-2-Ac024]|uniref:hypothetical protein n=1 Tax=Pseudooceanicola sp. LIPI14-2-Ac024 TaxID=3344875 RepID=UPI0035CF3420
MRAALDREFHRLADDVGAEVDGADLEVVDPDRDPQVGHLEARGGGGGRLVLGRSGVGQARDGQRFRRQVGDPERAGEEGPSAPVQLHVAQVEPDALVVGDGQLVERGAGEDAALEPDDPHLSTGIRQRAFDHADDEALAVVLVRVLRGGRQRERDESGEGQEDTLELGHQSMGHQKACPIPT